MFCYHHFCLVPKHFYLSKGNSYPISSHSSFPSAIPGNHQSALSLWIYLEISCKWNHTNEPFCVCLLSVSMMFSRFIHMVAQISTYSFLWDIIQHLCMNHICLSFYPLMDFWVIFTFFAIENSVAMNIPVQVFEYKLLGHIIILHLTFCEATELFTAAETFYVIAILQFTEGCNFSIFLSALVMFYFYDYSHPHRCEWYLIVVEIFILMMLNISSCVWWPLVYLFQRNVYRSLFKPFFFF